MFVTLLIVAAIVFVIVTIGTGIFFATRKPVTVAPVRRENNDFSMYAGIAENNSNVNQSGSYGSNGVFYAAS